MKILFLPNLFNSIQKDYKKYILISSVFLLLFNFTLWLFLLYKTEHSFQWQSILRILNHWDSGWYTEIVYNGYSPDYHINYSNSDWYTEFITLGYNPDYRIAFFPLYPFFIFLISKILPFQINPAVIGTLFSSIIFLFFCLILKKVLDQKSENYPDWFLPKNIFSWIFFVISPASYVFYTNHSESLFLILTFLSILFSIKKSWYTAAFFAGLCAITKNQGVFFSIFSAFFTIGFFPNFKDKVRIFLLSGLISGGLFSFFLIYQYILFSNPFAFIGAQTNWPHINHFSEYFKTFLLLNDNQDFSLGAIKHHIYFFIVLFFCIPLYRYSKSIFFYCIFCLLIIPFQASLINCFRYSVFLFPIFFIMGTYNGKYKYAFFSGIIILFLFLNIQTSINFFNLKWAY